MDEKWTNGRKATLACYGTAVIAGFWWFIEGAFLTQDTQLGIFLMLRALGFIWLTHQILESIWENLETEPDDGDEKTPSTGKIIFLPFRRRK